MADKSSAFSFRFESKALRAEEKADASVWKRFLYENRPFLPRVLLILLFSAVSAAAFVMIPNFFRAVVDLFLSSLISSLVKGDMTVDGAAMLRLLTPVAVTIVLTTVFSYLCDVFCSSLSSSLADRYRRTLFQKLGLVRMDYVDFSTKASVHRTSTESIDELSQGVNVLLSKAIASLILIIAIVVMVLRLDLRLGLIVLIEIPVQLLCHALLNRAEERNARTCGSSPRLPDIAELYENLDVLQLSGGSEAFSQRLSAQEAAGERAVMRARFSAFVKQHLTGFFTTLTMIAVILRGAAMSNERDFSLGLLLSLIVYVVRLEQPLAQLALLRPTMTGLSVAVRSIDRYLSAPEEYGGQLSVSEQTDAAVQFRNVGFRYADSPSDIISGFSFALPTRGVTVLFGASGSGKSTFVKLLLGLYTPQSGEITCGGRRLEQLDLAQYRSLFSLVSQEATLFDMPIDRNVAYPDARVDSERFCSVMEKLGLEDMLRPGIMAGTLSQGQIQLVLLARALYHNSRYIILDESFSHLDAAFEAQLYRILAELAKTHGVVVISHRATTLQNADTVLSFPLRTNADPV